MRYGEPRYLGDEHASCDLKWEDVTGGGAEIIGIPADAPARRSQLAEVHRKSAIIKVHPSVLQGGVPGDNSTEIVMLARPIPLVQSREVIVRVVLDSSGQFGWTSCKRGSSERLSERCGRDVSWGGGIRVHTVGVLLRNVRLSHTSLRCRCRPHALCDLVVARHDDLSRYQHACSHQPGCRV